MLSFSHNQSTLTVHEYLPMSAMSHAQLRMYRAFRLSKDLASYILELDKHFGSEGWSSVDFTSFEDL